VEDCGQIQTFIYTTDKYKASVIVTINASLGS